MLEEIVTEEQLKKFVHGTFEKFKNGNYISNGREYRLLKKYALTGLVNFDLTIDDRIFAKLTDTGFHYLKIMKRHDTI